MKYLIGGLALMALGSAQMFLASKFSPQSNGDKKLNPAYIRMAVNCTRLSVGDFDNWFDSGLSPTDWYKTLSKSEQKKCVKAYKENTK